MSYGIVYRALYGYVLLLFRDHFFALVVFRRSFRISTLLYRYWLLLFPSLGPFC